MPINLSSPIVQVYELKETDAKYGDKESEPTTVTIRQATQAQHEYRQQIFATLERKINNLKPEQTTLIQRANSEELKRVQAYLTLVGCNITHENGDLFKFKKGRDGLPELSMSKQAFDKAWGLLPPIVAAEIHLKVIDLNGIWGPMGG